MDGTCKAQDNSLPDGRAITRGAYGFTLVEVLTVVVIVAILAAIAVPSYAQFIARSKLQDATSTLQSLHLRLERYYQDFHAFDAGGACAVPTPATQYFTYACTPAVGGQGYFLTATNKAGVGLGPVGNYTYSIDDAQSKSTGAFDGAAGSATCWMIKRSDEC